MTHLCGICARCGRLWIDHATTGRREIRVCQDGVSFRLRYCPVCEAGPGMVVENARCHA